MKKRKCVADLEGNGLLDTVTRMWCGVFIDTQTREVFKFRPHQLYEMFDFMDTCDVLIFHNGYGYDFPALEKLYGYVYEGNKVDTLVMSRMLFPERRSHSVEAWGEEFGIPKPKHEDWSQFTEDMMFRCEQDTQIQLRLYKHCIEKSKSLDYPMSALRLSFKLFEILGKQEQSGWPVDVHYIHRNITLLSKWIGRIDKALEQSLPFVMDLPYGDGYVKKPFKSNRELSQISKKWFTTQEEQSYVAGPFTRVSFRRVNLGSPVETKNFLLSQGWKPKEWNYKKDKVGRILKDGSGKPIRSSPKLNGDDPFVGVSGSLGRLAAKRIQCVARRSILEGWGRSVRVDNRIAQRITGIAATGRLTHSGIVNVPGPAAFFGKQMRGCFIAPEGYVLVGTDSAGCQNRMLAARVGDPEFTEILINGDKEKGTAIHQVNQKAIKDIANLEVSYKESKNLNYAFMFGALDKKLGLIIGKDAKAGESIREALLSVSPGLKRLIDDLEKEWLTSATTYINAWGRLDYKNGYIRGLDGRPILIEHKKDVLVYALQSDEAIMMQVALCFLYKWLNDKGWVWGEHYWFVANVHDEYQCLVREDLVEEYIPLADKSISHAGEFLNIKCPHKGESDRGFNWAETH